MRFALLPALVVSSCLAQTAPDNNSGTTPAIPPVEIRPGAVWLDDRGQHIQAHGGGILKLGRTYFWFGEDRGTNNARNMRYVSS